ncbi:MAG: NDP-hexose 2,3-dehydratase family protein [Alphaproteobacteria bacterium]|nr:NDP-hexose 2,3-dehydratase family protein [Alphaproteobacteria bacterium]
MLSVANKLLDSWNRDESPVADMDSIFAWIEELNGSTHVKIEEIPFSKGDFWFYDKTRGEITNKKKKFFSVKGLSYRIDDKIIAEQPIIVQDEIGFLGIIVKEIDGILHFLMQAKIEPGNLNGVQISPTIQATRSNFTRIHGGQMPLYFDWFKESKKHGIILYDQIQSEQGSRFFGKRNRNIILLTSEDVPVFPNYKWLTLGQIKKLMKINNLINMDTRTVLSGILTIFNGLNEKLLENDFHDDAFFHSIFQKDIELRKIAFSMLNNYKMYKDITKEFMSLEDLPDWTVDNNGVTSAKQADFDIRYYAIEIEGRETQIWTQPLFKAKSTALFVLFTCVDNGVRKFLISLRPEIGCFDKVEFGPSIQIANSADYDGNDAAYRLFCENDKGKHFLVDVVLSEEGGRFYHEQNRNVIAEIEKDELPLSDDSLWVDYATLNALISNNNLLNIQLRNLLSLLDWPKEE